MTNNRTGNCAAASCNGDPLQFYMTAKNTGITFPYNPTTNSRYKVPRTTRDISQCRVDVHRQGDNFFNVAVFDWAGTQKGSNALSDYSSNGGYPITVPGLPSTLGFGKIGPFAASGAGMQFQYNANPKYNWFSSQTGSSLKYQPDGKYCSVTTSGTTQDLSCYFPCEFV